MNLHASVLSSPSMTFAREPIAALREDGIEDMLREHWKEVAHDKDVIDLNPDWTRYYRLEADGGFVGYGLRRAGHLIGYTGFFLNRSFHYRDHIFALNDVVYVQPKHRGVDGVVMILESEQDLRALGVRKVFYHAKTDAFLGDAEDSLDALDRLMDLEAVYGPFGGGELNGDTLGAVLEAVGYKHVENTYGKLLRVD